MPRLQSGALPVLIWALAYVAQSWRSAGLWSQRSYRSASLGKFVALMGKTPKLQLCVYVFALAACRDTSVFQPPGAF